MSVIRFSFREVLDLEFSSIEFVFLEISQSTVISCFIFRKHEMEPDIENMTISEYLEYEAAKERRLLDDVQSRRSPTNYNEVDVYSFHRNKTPATKSILDKLLQEFKDEILNVTMVNDEADFNSTKDLEELE
ncbi:hypothetical protein Tco_1124517 [Tanacetum coccineum]|uniref:Uncharacterized protein n=1 Tax=Tanacetum coccineum TaxID=301880 RepID=A0ABQ5J955_9ASTR